MVRKRINSLHMEKLKLIVLALFLLSFSAVAQAQNNGLDAKSELVFLSDSSLTKTLEDIICVKNTCSDNRKKINWYIEFKDSNTILITQGRIANLMELNQSKEREIFTTVVNDNLVFVIIDENAKLLSKTGFAIDLSGYVGKSVIAFEDYSSWLVKRHKSSYKIADSHIRNCD